MSNIQYVTSRDGTRLAMSVHAGGVPAVRVLLHLGDRLDSPGIAVRHWQDALAPHVSLVPYDARGCGFSDRQAEPNMLDICVEDLEAVVGALGAGPVVLLGLSHGSMVAVAFAARHPERVSRLVVYGGYARGRLRRGPDVAHAQEAKAILEAIQVAFGEDVPYRSAFLRTLSSRLFPSASPQQLDEVEAAITGRMSASVAAAYTTLTLECDVSEHARRVTCPTLQFHARADLTVPFGEGCHLASLIPQARLVPLDDNSNIPLAGNPLWPRVATELRGFLGMEDPIPEATPADVIAAPSTPNLTSRQIEVLLLISQGNTDKEIARALGLSPRTVEMHVGNALRALNCRTRAEGVHLAAHLGLLH